MLARWGVGMLCWGTLANPVDRTGTARPGGRAKMRYTCNTEERGVADEIGEVDGQAGRGSLDPVTCLFFKVHCGVLHA